MPPPPRIVAISGIVFATLFTAALLLIRLALPADPRDPGIWLSDSISRSWVRWALYLVPFSGIAFLWYMATLRNHIGVLEDKFFATVFLGSGLLFVAMLFVAVAASEGIINTFADADLSVAQSESYRFARAMAYALTFSFGMRMAAVFMFVTSTIGLRTSVLSPSVSLIGFFLGVLLLTVVTHFAWIALLFPLWVLVVSIDVLLARIQRE
jgi:hypothetical protein